MPFLHQPKPTPLWKEWDRKANKTGILHPIHFCNGDIFSGSWLNNMRHGPCTTGNKLRQDGKCSPHFYNISHLIKPKSREPLWKTWDYLAQKRGIHHTVYLVNGDQYTGDWLNNLKHGKGTFIWKETNKVYDGDWKKGKRSGFGTLTQSDGKGGFTKEYSGGWKNDLRHGYGTEFYSETKFYEGEWYAGKRSGWGRMYYEDGTIYEGEWYDDQQCGQGMLRLTNENRYEGSWKDGKKNGSGKFYYLDSGQIFEGVWQNDVPKCGTVRDFGRDNAPDPTQYPIPEIKLANPEAVMAEAELQFLLD